MKRTAKTGICIAVMLILVLLFSAADADETGWCGFKIIIKKNNK